MSDSSGALSVVRHHVVLFTKPGTLGEVKTRLQNGAPGDPWVLSPERALTLHRAFLEDTVSVLQRVSRRSAVSFEIAWALDDGEVPEPAFAHVPWFRQEGTSLGDRLFHGLSRCRESGVRVAVGSDHPELSAATVESAIQAIEGGGGDLALSPAGDGGYALLAVARELLARRLFEGIPWSTPAVLGRTLEAAETLGLRAVLVDKTHDCDTPADLEALSGRLAGAADPGVAPATSALLRAWGLIPDSRSPVGRPADRSEIRP